MVEKPSNAQRFQHQLPRKEKGKKETREEEALPRLPKYGAAETRRLGNHFTLISECSCRRAFGASKKINSYHCVFQLVVASMIEKVEVYIRNADLPVRVGFIRGPVDHPCLDANVTKIEKVISEADRRALEVVNEFAREKGLQVEICNVKTFRGRLKAGVKRISKTPVIIVGQSRIEGEHSSTQLKNKLTQCFTK